MAANVHATYEEDTAQHVREADLTTEKILKSIQSEQTRRNFKSAIRDAPHSRFSVTVELTSRFSTSPDEAFKLYHEGVVSFDTFKRLRLQSIGLPLNLVDAHSKDPLRLQAMTMAEELQLRPPPARDAGDQPPAKRAKTAE
jgi:hypothetical protein